MDADFKETSNDSSYFIFQDQIKRLVDLLLEDDQPITYMGVRSQQSVANYEDQGNRQRGIFDAKRHDSYGRDYENFWHVVLLQQKTRENL